ncbi:hypothetical protein E2C01_097663 [Portunus trituberculatus]|uniref:Uncharacterized protein n=1 Tax=Portunus trituberculatus TaxID=210409 RepID=A0A5B7KBZ3_PORTR|nr:hypothetical protein [Portunus trituberculatus]
MNIRTVQLYDSVLLQQKEPSPCVRRDPSTTAPFTTTRPATPRSTREERASQQLLSYRLDPDG